MSYIDYELHRGETNKTNHDRLLLEQMPLVNEAFRLLKNFGVETPVKDTVGERPDKHWVYRIGEEGPAESAEYAKHRATPPITFSPGRGTFASFYFSELERHDYALWLKDDTCVMYVAEIASPDTQPALHSHQGILYFRYAGIQDRFGDFVPAERLPGIRSDLEYARFYYEHHRLV